MHQGTPRWYQSVPKADIANVKNENTVINDVICVPQTNAAATKELKPQLRTCDPRS